MRLYDEHEIGAILKRTAELSKQRSHTNPDGLSLEEIQKLAADAGLDPDLVARAAGELSAYKPAPQERDFFGGPLAYATDFDLGVEVDDETWEAMLPAIRAHFGDPGTVATREGIYEWTGSSGEGDKKSHVYVRSTPSGSQLHIMWSQVSMAIAFYIPTLILTLISLPIIFDELALGVLGIPVVLLVFATVFMLSRLGVSSMRDRRANKIDQLGKDLSRLAYDAQLAGQSATTIEQESAGDSPESRIALDEATRDEAGDDEHRATKRRTHSSGSR